jgi:hypothetical protein
MKCIITGHSTGIGKALYTYFSNKGWNVIGMSRSNGYNIVSDIEKIVAESVGTDLFINNASDGDAQLNLLRRLSTKVSNIVTMGSAGTEFTEIWGKQYTLDKKALEEKFKLISMDTSVANMLLLKISFAETTHSRMKENRIDSDFTISYDEIATAIEFWLENPNIRQIDFALKLTPYTIDQVKLLSGKDDLVDRLLLDIENEIKK